MTLEQKILKVRIHTLRKQKSLCSSKISAAYLELIKISDEIERTESGGGLNWTDKQIMDCLNLFDELQNDHAILSNKLLLAETQNIG